MQIYCLYFLNAIIFHSNFIYSWTFHTPTLTSKTSLTLNTRTHTHMHIGRVDLWQIISFCSVIIFSIRVTKWQQCLLSLISSVCGSVLNTFFNGMLKSSDKSYITNEEKEAGKSWNYRSQKCGFLLRLHSLTQSIHIPLHYIKLHTSSFMNKFTYMYEHQCDFGHKYIYW